MKTFQEFFEDKDGAGSMTRAVMFGTWFVASIVMLWLCWDGKMSEGYFTLYLSIPAAAYAHSKYQDDKVTIATSAPVAAPPTS